MPYHQRDIVYVKREVPGGQVLKHPFLIISCEASNCQERDRYYTGVMITSNGSDDMFSRDIDRSMVETPLKEGSSLRLYIIVSFPESKIEGLVSVMKLVPFKAVLNAITKYVLVADERR
jgi:hypothetical protein